MENRKAVHCGKPHRLDNLSPFIGKYGPATITRLRCEKERTMKILVAYDGSKSAENALNLAMEHAKTFNASLDIITSAERTRTEKDLPLVEEAEQRLWQAEEECKRQNIPCSTHLLIRGFSPGEDTVQFAQENQVDEIVVGIRKESKVGKLVMGSTAQYIILKAPCPVVTVRNR